MNAIRTETEPMTPRSTAAIEALGISKTFGHVAALRDVAVTVRPGEVHAIVGDNGAGKSTFIRVLSGVYTPDSGLLKVDGHEVRFASPRDAISAGIATVHQDLALVDARNVTANLFLGRERTIGRFFVNRVAMRTEAVGVLTRLKVDLPSVNVPVSMLSGGQRQAVAIARAINQGGRIVVMDEPTAALGVQESARVLRLITQLRSEGLTVLLDSHNLEHVFDVADQVTVFNHGRTVATRRVSSLSRSDVVELITFGRLVDRAESRGQ